MKNLTSKEVKTFKRKFPDLKELLKDDETLIDKGIYRKVSVSVFDHWLTAEECIPMIYVDNNKGELDHRRNKFKAFIKTLSEQSEVYAWRYKRHERLHCYKLENRSEIVKKCKFDEMSSLTGKRFGLVFLDLGLVYREGWDWTSQLYFLAEKQLELLKQEAERSGLFILD
ncbi:hypothetical protein SAMN05216474_3037 [Lishizhenia tianjinensis]|uniref:Uncharacterized protein n=1 Tax=Lishizhenia tianjinensis TaxID=477690 RepID=A0A1I7BRX6_9FLAO|nr:hypothetical protein [Lishizhenia tianjinensis]SFT89935.1 hypothetical protein SAMN05216474_3037 [Lishizhenia tianjinensis]